MPPPDCPYSGTPGIEPTYTKGLSDAVWMCPRATCPIIYFIEDPPGAPDREPPERSNI